MTSFGSLKRLFACLSVPREVVSYLLSGSFDLSFQICALGHVKCILCLGSENNLDAIVFFVFEDFVALWPVIQIHAMRYDE